MYQFMKCLPEAFKTLIMKSDKSSFWACDWEWRRVGQGTIAFDCKICKTWLFNHMNILFENLNQITFSTCSKLVGSFPLHFNSYHSRKDSYKLDLPLQTHHFPLSLSYPALATTGLTAVLHLTRGFYSISRLFALAVNAIWDGLLSLPPPSSGSILH